MTRQALDLTGRGEVFGGFMLRLSRYALTAAMLLLTPGAAPAQSKDSDNEYTPTPQALSALSIEQAGALVSLQLPNWQFRLPSGEMHYIRQAKVGLSQIEITDENGHPNIVSLANARIIVVFGGFFQSTISINDIRLNDPTGLSKEAVAKLADAVYVLKDDEQQEIATDTGFSKVVSDYRQANPKPALPEDARRFQVQAEAAIKEGAFSDAAQLYRQGLAVAPWWPGGHFNRAAVLAEIGEFGPAIAEMQRYLLLAPDAPDARASQDKIYEWERQANKAAPASAQAAPPGSPPAKPAPSVGSLLEK